MTLLLTDSLVPGSAATTLQIPSLEREIIAAFRKSSVIGFRHLELEFEGRAIILIGKVISFYHKQMAQELVRQFDSRLQIINDLEVQEL